MDRNDRNSTDNQRRQPAQGAQNFHRNPQRPPAPDYRRQQRENTSYDRRDERYLRSEGSSRMNPRAAQDSRRAEQNYELPDRRQRIPTGDAGSSLRAMQKNGVQRNAGNARNPQDVRSADRSLNRYGNSPQNGDPRNARDRRNPREVRDQREPQVSGMRRDPRQRQPETPGNQRTRSHTGLQETNRPREQRSDVGRTSERDTRLPRQRDDRRFNAKDYARQEPQELSRNRVTQPTRVPPDDEYYAPSHATDPRRHSENNYYGMTEEGVDLKSFDINYKGDSDSSHSSPAILGKPMLLIGFAAAAVVLTAIVFIVTSHGNKTPKPDTDESIKYEYKIPDSVTIGGTKIKTDSDYIELQEMNLTEINDLSYCYLVNSLFINNNQIIDISPLSECISLKMLYANSNNINDLSPLSNLNQLSDLDISENRVTDLSPLSGLNQLERISASKNTITDITPLSGMTSLRQLILSDNQISDITPLSDLRNLTTLELAGNHITNLTALSGLSNISTLNLRGNGLKGVKSLKSMQSLTILDISDNPISDISPLTGLKNLLELNLSGTNVSKEDLEILKKALPDCRISK